MPQGSAEAKKRMRWIPLGLLFGVMGIAAAAVRGVWVYGDDVLVYQVACSILEHGTFEVTAPSDGDAATRAIPGRDGRRYAKYGPGLSLAVAPFVALGDFAGIRGWGLPETRDRDGNLRTGPRVWSASLLGPTLLGLLALAVYSLARKLSLDVPQASLAALLASLASPLTHLAMGLLSEPLSALLLTFSLLATPAWGESQRGPREVLAWSLSGIAYAGALSTRVFHLVLLPAFLGILLHPWTRRRSSLSTMARVLAWGWAPACGLGLLAALNQFRFGSPLETGYGSEAFRFDGPLLDGLLGLTLSPGKGLVWFWPAVLLAGFGWRDLRRLAPVHATGMAMGSLSLLLAASAFYQWHGGGVWGPRLLTPLVGWLAVAAIVGWGARSSSGSGRFLAGALLGTSLLVAWLPQAVPFERTLLLPRPEEPSRLEPSEWSLPKAPWIAAGAELPEALLQTYRKLVGLEPLQDIHVAGAQALHAPDFAFVRYGSHALLQLTRVFLLAGGLFLGWTLLQLRSIR